MIDVVLGANVLASGFAGVRRPNSTPGELVRRWWQRAFRLVVSDHIIAEIGRTLSKPYVRRQLTPRLARSGCCWPKRSAR